jgi:hypothetical protein
MKWIKASEIANKEWNSRTVARFIHTKLVIHELRDFLERYPDRISTVEILDESPQPLPVGNVEEAAKEYFESNFDQIGMPTIAESFIAGAAWQASQSPVSDAVGFAEWVDSNKWWSDFEDGEANEFESVRWSNDSENYQYLTTAQLYQIFLNRK